MSKVELICLKDKQDPCPFKRKRKGDKPFYNCIKSYSTKHPPCEWVIYEEESK